MAGDAIRRGEIVNVVRKTRPEKTTSPAGVEHHHVPGGKIRNRSS